MSHPEELVVLRQVAALRRAGSSHGDALRAAADGLPVGELRDRVTTALRRLASGAAIEASAGTIDRALAGDVSIEGLDLAALAVEARLDAREAVATGRLYLGVALAGPPLLVGGLAWGEWVWPLSLVTGMEAPLASVILWLFRLLCPLVAALGYVLSRRLGARWAPGIDRLEAAVNLLDPGGAPGRLDSAERIFLETRRAAVGPRQAAREVAAELVESARHALLLFRWTAPLAAAVLLIPFFYQVFYVFTSPAFALTGSLDP